MKMLSLPTLDDENRFALQGRLIVAAVGRGRLGDAFVHLLVNVAFALFRGEEAVDVSTYSLASLREAAAFFDDQAVELGGPYRLGDAFRELASQLRRESNRQSYEWTMIMRQHPELAELRDPRKTRRR